MLIDPELRQRVIDSLSWMVADMRHRFDECRQNLEEGSGGGYSPELTEAIDLLNELSLMANNLPGFAPPPITMHTWTEQQCRDQAVMIGMPEEWGSGYFRTYASQGWLKGNGVPITNVRLHMAKLRNEGVEYADNQTPTEVVRDKEGLTPRERDIQESGR